MSLHLLPKAKFSTLRTEHGHHNGTWMGAHNMLGLSPTPDVLESNSVHTAKVLWMRLDMCIHILLLLYYYYYWSLLYSAILRSQADSLRFDVILHEWIAFYSAFLIIHRSGVLTALTWLVPHETAAVSACSVYTIQPCTMSLHAKPHT